jgi:hypothetical protein
MVFLLYVLMNRVVGEARERKTPAGKQNFNFVSGR